MRRKRADKLPPESEEEFQGKVEQLARLYGWDVYHTRFSLGSSKGFPDLVLARPPILLFRELKTDKGELTVEQKNWLHLLGACNQDAEVWRPENWDAVLDVLRGD